MPLTNDQKRSISAWYGTVCPERYQTTDLAKLPDLEAYNRVLAWTRGDRGILAVGVAGTGKTRAIWALVLRLALDSGWPLRFAWFDAGGWASAVARAFGDPDATDTWLARVSTVDYLLLDDLFKAKLTDAQELAIHTVLERRSNSMRPTFATTNSGRQDVVNAMTDRGKVDRADGIIRRLEEFCERVQFRKPGVSP